MLFTDLPLDILELVIRSFIGDFATLKSLTLVCRLFRDPCQQHIFRFVTVDDTARCCRLIDGLRSNPTFLRHVQRICVGGNQGPGASWLFENMDVITEFLNLISEARLIHFSLSGDNIIPISWAQLSSPLKEELSKIFAKIKSLQLIGFYDIPIDILTPCHKNITDLDLLNSNFVQGSAVTPGSPRLRLHYLKIFTITPGMVEALISSGILDLSQLELLDFGSGPAEVDLSPLVQSRELRGLHLKWLTPNIILDQAQKSSLRSLNHLKTLEISTRWKRGRTSPNLKCLADALSTLESPHLTTVLVTVAVPFIPVGGDFVSLEVLSVALDQLHQRSGGRLKTLDLTFEVSSPADKLEEIQQGINDRIQWKGDSKVLSLTVAQPPGFEDDF
ncbi:hypothetical protein BDN72DRAFT_843703 [Pluteus cervinus]|uniref:Uncharacterized protein n=1 Tax=Pluteus cervinus TaxID=181527 RepID=A0ACD3ALP6_9AGAR|nr:hypothetical protein BDN72DRAFT_843703 [Pluteus cervinus]